MKKLRSHYGGYTTKKSRSAPGFKIEYTSIAEIEARRLEIRRQSAEKHRRTIREEKDRGMEPQIVDSQNLSELSDDIPSVGMKDFVVKRNTFMCIYETHHSENINAVLRIIPFGEGDNECKYVKVAAGYCSACKVFYIMNSTYEKIRKMGVPECRVCDESTYLEIKNNRRTKLARESILMQHGYNVNKIEGLNERTRHKILAMLIDNGILTKGDIVSYLDFFIKQRANVKEMEIAISKWENDRDFVNKYRIGDYTTYGVSGLSRGE